MEFCSSAFGLPAALSVGHPPLGPAWEVPSSSTVIVRSTIKERHPRSAIRGLGGCATTMTTNPFVFATQVCKQYSLFSKRTSNYFLVQLPGPRCCVAVAVEIVDAIRCLLLLAGDIESNPGPDTSAVLSELRKLTTGQSQLISEVKNLKDKLLTTEQTLTVVSQRLTDLEHHYQNLLSIRTDIDSLRADCTQTAGLVCNIEARLDEAENHSRRNNLIFYGVPETNTKESFAQSEQLIIDICRNNLDVNVDPKEIDRAHRLGKFSQNRRRPIIVKFTFHKTKSAILSCGRKFKGTDYSVGEDFSTAVRTARKHLLAFAKSKAVPYSLRYKTLFIGPQRYIFDALSETVKECSV
ncbi:uncharacterized protein LOC119405878 [Rhipicephalus sanguineus]|uniref:uncharacterized protein LOC119405878 n=1 Tax=Rhipicephalus sanguineus TaxID=34632 RepID=UPI001893DBD1|nr:uncharacterized protein LOC119405878 [Rhipicephalus sanguineus]